MSALAEILTAPAGTQIRTSESASWETAKVGDKMYLGYQARNTQENKFKVQLFSDAQIKLDNPAPTYVYDISGDVYIKNANDEWIQIDEEGEYTIKAVQAEGEMSTCAEELRSEANKIESDGVDVRT